MGFDEIIRDNKASLKAGYIRDLKEMEENYKIHYAAYLIQKKWNEISTGDTNLSLTTQGATLWLYLDKTQNVSKDVMLFVEEISGIAKGVTGADYTTCTDSATVDFIWRKDYVHALRLYFSYSSGNCQRKLIREETRIIKEPVYELVCN